VKIDRSFVCGLDGQDQATGPKLSDLAGAIIQLTRTLGHTPIAEGVEHREQAARLAALGCRLVQGYHVGEPQDAADTAALLEELAARSAVPLSTSA